jgi:diketogulonate reductase-like aldo/keto reductase
MELNNIGFGTYRLKKDKCYNAVLNALKVGYRTIDTAELYKNHEYISKAITDSSINRQNIHIISKILNKDQYNNTVKEGFFKILNDLNTNYLDTILLHAPVENYYLKSWKILEEIKMHNYVNNIGVSNFRIHELVKLFNNCNIKPFLNQIEINPFNTRISLSDYCKNNNMIVQSYAPLTNGIKLNTISIPATKILKWCLDNNYYAVSSSTNIEHMIENLNSVNVTLSNEDNLILNSLNENFYTIPHYTDYTD